MTRQASPDMLDASGVAGWRPDVVEAVAERRAATVASVELVLLARGGDADAFDALVRPRLDRAYRLAVAILRSEMDARDAVQEAFVAAWRQLPGLRDPAKFDPWLERIVVNACRMALRHRRALGVREIDVSDPAGPASQSRDRAFAPGADEGLADADLVRRALGRLDADKRAILVLHHVMDRPLDEIAVVLKVPIGTVKWRLHAARAALQRALEEDAR